MPKSRRKYNSVGGVGCACLLLLMFLLANPFVELSVNALKNTEDDVVGGTEEQAINNTEANNAATDSNAEIELYASTPSTVGIEFSPAAGSGSLTPTDSNGAKAKIDVQATVKVKNSGGFKVYVGSATSDLVNGNNTIPTLASDTVYTDIPVDRWGYALIDNGTSSSDTTTYSPMPGNVRDIPIRTIPGNIKDEQTYSYLLSFAANISGNMPAGTYSNKVTLSVVSSPLEVTIDDWGITDMQQMTSAICTDAKDTNGDGENATQLKDARDGKYYWVGKLADGRCWMTQNLALDLSDEEVTKDGITMRKTLPLTPDTSDVSTNWTPKSADGQIIYNTATTANSDTILADDTGQRSWNLGSYYIDEPNGTTNCGIEKSSLAGCVGQFTALPTPTSANVDTNAHWLAGNYYQWCAATAGCTNGVDSGANLTSGEASGSICPKGWRLPTSGASGEFQALVDAYNATTTKTLVEAPLYFVRGGFVYQDTSELLGYAGRVGYYWSSTTHNGIQAYSFDFDDSSAISPSNSYLYRQVGRSVRCIAR